MKHMSEMPLLEINTYRLSSNLNKREIMSITIRDYAPICISSWDIKYHNG